MRAVCWCGTKRVQVQNVPDPILLDTQDAIVEVSCTTICGSDLHLYNGLVASMMRGDILGHEIMGEVVEVGGDVRKLQVGQRVVAASVIACGRCWYCKQQQFSLCDNSNPHGALQEKIFGYATAGIFGYSQMFGGYAGAQAEYVRIPFADVGAFPVPDGMSDAQALAFSDIFPTGYMGADLCGIERGDIVAVWGCGPVGQFAIKSAMLLGAEKVIAIDNIPERLQMAAKVSGAHPLDHDEVDVLDELKVLTGGRGPDACIDAVGMEAHGTNFFEDLIDKMKQKSRLQTDRPSVVRQMVKACRKGGTIVIMGAYAGYADTFPIGLAMNKGLRWHMGQQHGQRYIPRLFDHWQQGHIDPAFVFTHRVPLSQAAEGYQMFEAKEDGCVKLLLEP